MAVLVAAPQVNAKTGRALWLVPLLQWRESYGFGRVEEAVLALYALVIALTLPYHEPWADEAQAWLIARDNSYWDILRHRLHYEGSPLLWHYTLRTLHLLHLPWLGLGWCGALFAVAGVAVWLWRSPFPLALRVLLPFTFFVQYQYAVVARSYVMFPLLLFALCSVYSARKQHLVWFAVAAALLANLCMQGTVVSATMCALYAWDLRVWRAGERRKLPRGRLAAAGAILSTAGLLCVYTAMPAPDVGFVVDAQVRDGAIHTVLVKLLGETARNRDEPPPEFTFQQDMQRLLASVPPEPGWQQHPREWLAWQLRTPSSSREMLDGTADALWPMLELPSELLWSISNVNLLALAFVVALVVWARKRRGLRYLLPACALWMTGEFLWIADHHAGMLLLTIFAGAWLASARGSINDEDAATGADRAFLGLAALVLLLQVGWTVHAVRADRRDSYDPSGQTAAYLHTMPAGARMAAFHFYVTGIEPYFAKNPFFNLPSSWWQWCTNIVVDHAHAEVIASHPDVVVYTREHVQPDSMRNQIVPLNVFTGYEPEDPILTDLRERGYLETHRFCGRRFARLSAPYEVCDMVFEPGAGAGAKLR